MRSRLRTSSVAAALLVAASAPASAQVDAGLRAAVREFDPGLRVPDEPDRVHVADFDGDGLRDIATILIENGRSALVVFHAADGGYVAHPLFTNLPAGEVRLRVVPPGSHAVVGPQGAVRLDAPAIELVFPGRSSALYAWRGGRYQVFGTESY